MLASFHVPGHLRTLVTSTSLSKKKCPFKSTVCLFTGLLFFNGNSSAYSLDIRFLIHSGYKIHGAGWLINKNVFFKVLHVGKFKNKAKHHVLCHTSNSLLSSHGRRHKTELWSLVSKGSSSTPKSREFKNLSPKNPRSSWCSQV